MCSFTIAGSIGIYLTSKFKCYSNLVVSASTYHAFPHNEYFKSNFYIPFLELVNNHDVINSFVQKDYKAYYDYMLKFKLLYWSIDDISSLSNISYRNQAFKYVEVLYLAIPQIINKLNTNNIKYNILQDEYINDYITNHLNEHLSFIQDDIMHYIDNL